MPNSTVDRVLDRALRRFGLIRLSRVMVQQLTIEDSIDRPTYISVELRTGNRYAGYLNGLPLIPVIDSPSI